MVIQMNFKEKKKTECDDKICIDISYTETDLSDFQQEFSEVVTLSVLLYGGTTCGSKIRNILVL